MRVLVTLLLATLAATPALNAAGGESGPARFELMDLGATADTERSADPSFDEEMARYRAAYGMLPATSAILPTRYPIYPFAGLHDVDVHPVYYVDLDPAPSSRLDFGCGAYTYDGHDAVDFRLHSFGEQDGEVPVFAALSGRIVHAQDGHQDRQRECSQGTENYVRIDHGGGHVTGYGHLRKNSVRVAFGDLVEAGEQIGLIASSGCSSWPHLHFVTNLNDDPVEAHAGPCNPGRSGWRDQRPHRDWTQLADFGFSVKGMLQLDARESPPEPLPRLGRIGKRDRQVHLWGYLLKLEPGTSFRVRGFDPRGRLAYDSGAGEFDNTEMIGFAIGWHTIDTRPFRGNWGTWVFELSIDGEVAIEAPLEIRKKAKRKLNRPPVDLDGVHFEPAKPRANQPIVCIAETTHLLEDPDYDIVHYSFVWAVNGEVVRAQRSAARTDVLAARIASEGDTVTCSAVPDDGRAAGEGAVGETVVR